MSWLYVHIYDWRQIPPPAEKFGSAACQILVGTLAHQPNLDHTSWKSDGGAAEGSSMNVLMDP